VTATPKTIQIFLPSGEPHGIRLAEITTRIVQVIEVPRSLLSSFLAMEQSSQVGVYFLIGEHTEDGDRLVYVGQTGDLRARLNSPQPEEGLLGAGLGAHLQDQQPHADPRVVPGVAFPPADSQCRSLCR